MAERNWAEHDRNMQDNPTLDDCRALARTHRAYGWTPRPWGHWSDEQKDAYNEGYKEPSP